MKSNASTLVTVREAADLLGVPAHSIRQAINRGELEAYRLTPGRTATVYVQRTALSAWLETRRVGGERNETPSPGLQALLDAVPEDCRVF